jgi:hypothetical protein
VLKNGADPFCLARRRLTSFILERKDGNARPHGRSGYELLESAWRVLRSPSQDVENSSNLG